MDSCFLLVTIMPVSLVIAFKVDLKYNSGVFALNTESKKYRLPWHTLNWYVYMESIIQYYLRMEIPTASMNISK